MFNNPLAWLAGCLLAVGALVVPYQMGAHSADAQLKATQAQVQQLKAAQVTQQLQAPSGSAQATSEASGAVAAAPAPVTYVQPGYVQPNYGQQPVIINNGGGHSNAFGDAMMGAMVGNALSGPSYHGPTVIERTNTRYVPVGNTPRAINGPKPLALSTVVTPRVPAPIPSVKKLTAVAPVVSREERVIQNRIQAQDNLTRGEARAATSELRQTGVLPAARSASVTNTVGNSSSSSFRVSQPSTSSGSSGSSWWSRSSSGSSSSNSGSSYSAPRSSGWSLFGGSSRSSSSSSSYSAPRSSGWGWGGGRSSSSSSSRSSSSGRRR